MRFCVLALAATGVVWSQGIMTTFAGIEWIFPGSGKPATDAPLGAPRGVAVDRQGNVYIADELNSMVMRVDAAGIITVIGGNGLIGFSGDGGRAANAALWFPYGVAVDAAGNVFIADRNNHRIRKVTPDGIITTAAGNGRNAFSGDGGPAVNASLSSPNDVTVDAAGNLYIAAGQRVRKVTPDGIITTVAGNGQLGYSGDGGPALAASFRTLFGVEVDSDGNLYIADRDNHRIRKVTRDGTVNTFAGTGQRGFSGDNGPAANADLNFPTRVFVDGARNVVIAAGNRVRKVDPQGRITTVAGNGQTAFSGDGGPAIAASFLFTDDVALDTAGNLYIADRSGRIRRVNVAGIISTFAGKGGFRVVPEGSPAASAFLYSPSGLALDSAGNLLVVERDNYRLRRITPGGRIFTVAGTGTSACGADHLPAQGSIMVPLDVAVDPSGGVHFSEPGCARVRRLRPDGTVATVAGIPVQGGFSGDGGPATLANINVAGIAFDRNGSLYIADPVSHRIRRVTPDGIIRTVAGNGQNGFSGDGGPALMASLNSPRWVAVDSAGDLYVTDSGNHRIRKVTSDGTIFTLAGDGRAGAGGDGGPAIAASLNSPAGLGFDGAGNLLIADEGNHRIRRVTRGGVIETVASQGRGFAGDGGPATLARLNFPEKVVVEAAGRMYISDLGNDRIRVVENIPVSFQVAPGALAFAASSGGAPPPEQSIRLSGSIAGLPFDVTAGTADGGSWLRVTPPAGSMPAGLQVVADPAALAQGVYRATITIRTPVAGVPPQVVAVTFTVLPPNPPRLAVEPDGMAFSFAEPGGADRRQLKVLNRGSGTFEFSASVSVPWLSLAPESGGVFPAAPATLTVAANPAGLRSGTYTGRVVIASPAIGQSVSVPVTMTISNVRRSILLSQTGLNFTAVAGGGFVPPQSFAVLNAAEGVMGWTVSSQTLSGGPAWLAVSPASGSSDATSLQVPFVEVAINPAGLAPGAYYGQARVVAGAADNSPQVVSVVLNVLPPGSDPGPLVRPTGLVFTGIAGGASPGTQAVVVSNLSARATSYVSGRLTSDNRNWFINVPASGPVTPQEPARILVQVETGELTPGVRRGTLTLQFEDGAPRNVSLLLVLISGVPGGPRSIITQAGCVPSRLFPVFTLLPENFSVPAAWPNPVEVRVVDDCANPMLSGSVSLAFSNGDPPLGLVSLRDGRWSGTWQARNATTAQVTVTATAEIPEPRIRGTAQVTGGLRANQEAPVVGAGAVVSAASYAAQAPLAPGSLVSIFGSRLSEGEGSSPSLPLREQLAGTLVVIAGRAMPLLYASQGQINAMIPYDLPVNTRHQVVVRRGSSYAVPEPVSVAAAQPAIFTKDQSGKGQGVIVDLSNRYVEPGNAASAGDAVVIYCSGLGAVDPPVAAGTAAPSSPLSRTVNPVMVRIGGVEAEVLFAGLTPSFSGLYQVNALVPTGAGAGDEVPVVLTVAGQASPPVTMAVR